MLVRIFVVRSRHRVVCQHRALIKNVVYVGRVNGRVVCFRLQFECPDRIIEALAVQVGGESECSRKASKRADN